MRPKSRKIQLFRLFDHFANSSSICSFLPSTAARVLTASNFFVGASPITSSNMVPMRQYDRHKTVRKAKKKKRSQKNAVCISRQGRVSTNKGGQTKFGTGRYSPPHRRVANWSRRFAVPKYAFFASVTSSVLQQKTSHRLSRFLRSNNAWVSIHASLGSDAPLSTCALYTNKLHSGEYCWETL